MGIGISVSFAAGFEKMIEKMSPRRIESFPAYGRTYPCTICYVKRRPDPSSIDSTIPFAMNTFPCIIPILWHSNPMMRLSMKYEKKLVWAKWQNPSDQK